MGYLTPGLTVNGAEMLRQALLGKGLVFTKIVFGDGTPTVPEDQAAAVKHPVVTLNLSDITRYRDYVLLSASFDNSGLESGFWMKELGVYAKDTDENEVLYAYRYNSSEIDYMPDRDCGRTIQRDISIIVAIGELTDVDAIIVESDAYASKEAFNSHLRDFTNPHKVSKGDVGLDKVDNKVPSDLTVNFSQSSKFLKISSGETLSVLFGKILRFFTVFNTHTDAKNPHGLTLDDIGGAAKSHTHKASDITSGTLSISRGGTGVGSLANLKKLVASNPDYTDTYLTASGWNNGVYSFSQYRDDSWNLDISISPGATQAQQEAFMKARLAGSASGNRVTALGTVPDIDIPIILKAEEIL